MKKLIFALAMFLPMLALTACGGDDKDPVTEGYTIATPVLKWGKSMQTIKSEVSKNGNLTLDLSLSDNDELVYWTKNSELPLNMPMYTYYFEYDALEEAAIALPGSEYNELLQWVDNRYVEYGVDEDGVIFLDNQDPDKATTLVLVSKAYSEGLTLSIAAFVNMNSDTRASSADPKATVAKTLDLLKAKGL